MTRTIPFTGTLKGQPHLSFAGSECPMCGSNGTVSLVPLRFQDISSVVFYSDSLLSCRDCGHEWPVGNREAAGKGLVRVAGRVAATILFLLIASPALSDDLLDLGVAGRVGQGQDSIEARQNGRNDGTLDVYRNGIYEGQVTHGQDGVYRYQKDLGLPTFHEPFTSGQGANQRRK